MSSAQISRRNQRVIATLRYCLKEFWIACRFPLLGAVAFMGLIIAAKPFILEMLSPSESEQAAIAAVIRVMDPEELLALVARAPESNRKCIHGRLVDAAKVAPIRVVDTFQMQQACSQSVAARDQLEALQGVEPR